MKQICDDAYWEHMESALARNGDPKNPGKPCGKTFDDYDHSTLCPHEYFPPSQNLQDVLGTTDPQGQP